MYPNFSIEDEYSSVIAGIDESGRGPLAGPVVAACVIIDRMNYPKNLNDSKKISKSKRESIFEELKEKAKFGVGIVDECKIDEINILNATKLAMKLSVLDLCEKKYIPDMVLVDGNFVPDLDIKSRFVIKGDQKSCSIAAASIVAKCVRDKIMLNLDKQYPQYEWSSNMGYPTKVHLGNIKKFGVCKHHRKSFAPVRRYCEVG